MHMLKSEQLRQNTVYSGIFIHILNYTRNSDYVGDIFVLQTSKALTTT